MLVALRRELVTSSTLVVRETVRPLDGAPASWIAIADPDRIAALADADLSDLTTFDEWRGGCGMTSPSPGVCIEAHGGRIWSPAADAKAGAVIAASHLRKPISRSTFASSCPDSGHTPVHESRYPQRVAGFHDYAGALGS